MKIAIEILRKERIDEFFEVFEKVMKTACEFYSKRVINYFLGRLYTKESFLIRIQDGTLVVFLGMIDQKTVGFLVADVPYGGVAFCRWLGVLKEYQKKGVGKRLVEEWVKWAKKNRCHRVLAASVTAAVGFYEKCGLKKEGLTNKGYFGVDQYRVGRVIGKIDEESFTK
jgi:GNAT superfamily N-acetyltransferase